MIAYLLLRIAARLNGLKMPALRLAELVGQFLFTRNHSPKSTKPPPVNPSKPKPRSSPDQLEALLCLIFPGQPCAKRERVRVRVL